MKRWLKIPAGSLPDMMMAVGMLSITVGAGLIYVPAGFIVGGMLLVGVGILLARFGEKGGTK